MVTFTNVLVVREGGAFSSVGAGVGVADGKICGCGYYYWVLTFWTGELSGAVAVGCCGVVLENNNGERICYKGRGLILENLIMISIVS